MELGKMDFVVPMVYWEMDHKTHPFGPLVTEWTSRVAYDRPVIPGILMGLEQKFGWSEIEDEIEAARERGAVGVVFFSASGLEKESSVLGANEFPYWSDVPQMIWKDSVAPQPPTQLSLKVKGSNATLTWNPGPGDEGNVYFNVYRSSSPVIDVNDVKELLFVTGRYAGEFLDSTAEEGNWYYAVTAVDRAGNESKLSSVVPSDSPLTSERMK